MKLKGSYNSMTILDKLNRDMRTDDNRLSDEKDNKQVFISIDKLIPSKKNEQILIVDDGLKDTIQDDGLLTPLLVMRKDNNQYEIISGNRRYTSIKSLMKDNPNFKYKWKGSVLRDPKEDGLPCNVVENLNDIEKTLIIIGANKVRDYDKLELYRSVLELRDVYNALKQQNKIRYGDGGIAEWLAARLPISARTISDILSDRWLINSNNYSNIVNEGSYEKYSKSFTEKALNEGKANSESSSPKLSKYDKEFKKLESIENYYSKFNNEGLENRQFDDLKKYATNVIISIMDALDVSRNDLK